MFEIIKVNIKTVLAKKTVFVLLFLAQIINVVALLYTYAMVTTIINIDMEAGVFRIELSEDILFENIDTDITEFANNHRCDAAVVYLDQNKTLTASKYGTRYNYTILGDTINPDSAENQMVAAENTGLNINDNVELFDKNYRVVGIGVLKDSEINYSSISNETKIYSLEITNKSLRTKRARRKYIEAIEEIFESKVTQNGKIEIKQITGNVLFLLMSAIILSAFASLLLGYKYINDKRKENYRVYNILGQTRLQSIITIFLEATLFCLLCYILGAIIYCIADLLLLINLSVNYTLFQLSIFDYILLGAIFILCVSVLLTFYIINIFIKRRKRNFAFH